MKQYPSIVGSTQAPRKPCIAFQKLDGSNLRFEWQRKTGWQKKYGSRQRLFDETDEMLGPSIPIFYETLADPIEAIIRGDKWLRQQQRVTVFAEFFGPKSFAGNHDLEPGNEPMELRLFDVWVYKYGLIGPRDFIKTFGHLPTPEVVYEGNLNAEFIADVKAGRYNLGDGIEEGVVCKGGKGGHRDLWMAKIKTDAYIAKLKEVFRVGWEQYAE
tara:strand:+ start:88994 stop:89635 length:642 start_codon:yes stop_codon:yes gene_type:complete